MPTSEDYINPNYRNFIDDFPDTNIHMYKESAPQKPCDPNSDEVRKNSGTVHFQGGQGNVAAGGAAGDVLGTFTTDAGYSGSFHTSFEGGAVGEGIGYGKVWGVSENLGTFEGKNYNVVATLFFYAMSDNFDPATGEHIGETDEFTWPGLSFGVTRSLTDILSLVCP